MADALILEFEGVGRTEYEAVNDLLRKHGTEWDGHGLLRAPSRFVVEVVPIKSLTPTCGGQRETGERVDMKTCRFPVRYGPSRARRRAVTASGSALLPDRQRRRRREGQRASRDSPPESACSRRVGSHDHGRERTTFAYQRASGSSAMISSSVRG